MTKENSIQDKVSFTDAEVKFIKKLDEKRVRAEAKFPLIIALSATFGFVSVLYGFEKLIDSVPFLERNPIILLLVGLIVLAVTGKVHKKLD